MSLTAGMKLGPYEVTAPLGAGGMGEVYRAKDTRLDRTVAIKVLPGHLSDDPERRARFDREAKAISALTHPHICTLHDVGHQDGIDYLVMELLEGDSLATRLAKGPLPLDQVLRYGREIASALDKAHKSGVIHRDLKPGNIVLTKSGAKLLDFGLAKGVPLTSSEPSAPTLTQPLTSKGTLVGTFQYMSPEQLEGKDADARTDIFAFGAVLYEMATGKRAFEGKSQASLIASIMHDVPTPISQVQSMTPPALDRLVRKCLAKDPDERWQSAADVADELRWIAEGNADVGTARHAKGAAHRPSLWMWLAWGLVTLAACALTLRFAPHADLKVPEARPIRLSMLPEGSIDVDPEPANTSVSPDGAYLVFVASERRGTRRIWIRPLASQAIQPLPGTEDADVPFWSPDSRYIAFFAGGKLKKVARDGGTTQVLCDARDGRGGTWNRDDIIVFAPSSGGALQRVSATGGVPTQVTQLDSERGESAHRFPCFLPDGKHFLYVTLPQQRRDYPVRVASLDGDKPVDLMKAWGSPRFAPPGILVYPKGAAIIAHRFDTERLTLVGEGVPIPDISNVISYRSGGNPVSVSANGVLAYACGFGAPTRLVWLDRDGKQGSEIQIPEGCYLNASISPDGESVCALRESVEADDLLRIDLARSVATRLTFDNYPHNNPKWSPDGQWIALTSTRQSTRDLYRIAARGGSAEELVAKLEGSFNDVMDWSRDGRYIVFRSLNPQTNDDIWIAAMDQDRKPVPFLNTPFFEADACFSPDGKWVAYHTDESGRNELCVRSFPVGANKTQISSDGANVRYNIVRDNVSVWWRRPDEILYLDADASGIVATSVEVGESVKVGATRPLFRLPPGTIEVTASADGQRFLATMTLAGRAQSAPTVVINWDAGLRKP
ncbi:MAG TPA: protein kinase [Phycisphaerae bacterium]|nr:protein kinase [Phycisphaerae bacterium]